MKKDRNSFFQSSNFNMSASGNMPNFFNPMPMYADNMNMGMNVNEIEARLSKLERSINRLDARLNKLESNNGYINDNYNIDGNMYMV